MTDRRDYKGPGSSRGTDAAHGGGSIIDVTPAAHSRSRIKADRAQRRFRQAGYGRADTGWERGSGSNGGAAGAPAGERAWRKGSSSVPGGIAQVVLGAGLVALGIPMLILPGPGLLAIGAGALFVSRGLGALANR